MTIDGEERNGRISFENGHALARKTFQEALASENVELILLAEYLFVSQELAESDNDEPEGKASAEAALHSFDDAFLSLEAVEEGAAYRIAEKVIPHSAQYRYQGLPKDCFHIACFAHKTRLKNGLSRLGLPKLDRELAKTRVAALGAIQLVYVDTHHAARATAELETKPYAEVRQAHQPGRSLSLSKGCGSVGGMKKRRPTSEGGRLLRV
jgi:hypothetical protein